MNGKNRQLDFPPQAIPSLNLQLSRKVFVPTNGAFVRWINVVTNTASAPQQVGIGLRACSRIWRLPRVLPAGTTYPGPVRHVDIVPTVLALLGLPGGDTMQRANLLPALEGRVAPLDLPQYSEARLAEKGFGMAPLSGVRHAGRKWIRAPRPELYDLHDDPRELENLYPSAPAVARPLQVDEELVLADSARHAITGGAAVRGLPAVPAAAAPRGARRHRAPPRRPRGGGGWRASTSAPCRS